MASIDRSADHFFGGVVVFLFVVEVPAGFAVVSFDVPDVEPVVDPVPVDGVLPMPLPVVPVPVVPVPVVPVPVVPVVPVVDEPEPVVDPEPIESVLDEPMPDVPVVLGVPVEDGMAVPVLDGIVVDVVVSVVVVVVPELVVGMLSGDFAGSLSPPQATEPTTSAVLRTM